MSQTAKESSFFGTWILQSCEHRLFSGGVLYPLGKGASGLLIYTPGGHMSGCLMQAGRPSFESRELFGGLEKEQAAAMNTYLHYAGKFKVVGDEVHHLVEWSLFPNWVGSTQKRIYRFEGDQMELSTRPFIWRQERQTAHLLWKKAP